MPSYRIGQAAELLDVSVDTVRRLVDTGRLRATKTAGGRRLIDGRALAKFAAASRGVRIGSTSSRGRAVVA